MKKRNMYLFKVFFILNALLIFFLFNVPNTFAEFYVIAGGRGVGTEIKSLPRTISSPGFYYIKKDLSCTAGSHGIKIEADNVTLDLMGFSLAGPGLPAADYDGIYMDTRSNVEIRNGTVRNFARNGINECGDGTGHRIINIRAKDNVNAGIILSCKSNIVEKCTVTGNNGIGIYAWNCSTITGNVCYDNGSHGIFTSAGSTVTDNTCYHNGHLLDAGHGINGGSRSTITGNNCYDNIYDGINATSGSTVTGNTCNDNDDDGISAGIGTTVVGNTCRGNANYGINLGGDNLVDQNTVTNNTTDDMSSCTGCVYGVNVPVAKP